MTEPKLKLIPQKLLRDLQSLAEKKFRGGRNLWKKYLFDHDNFCESTKLKYKVEKSRNNFEFVKLQITKTSIVTRSGGEMCVATDTDDDDDDDDSGSSGWPSCC